MRKHNFPAILLAAMVTCTLFTGCGKTESNEAVAQQLKTETETETALETEETESAEETSEESEETVTEETFSQDIADYTFTDMDKTMYAKGTIKLRNLPSTAGDKLDKLSENQEVTVTGQCNETGWYRVAYNDSEGYVSDKSLSDSPVSTNASTAQSGNSTATASTTAVSTEQAQASTGKTKTTSTASTQSTGDPIADAAIAKFGPNAVVFADGTIFDATTWQQVGTVDDLNGVDNKTVADGFDRAAAEQVWSLMNAERTSAGLNALAWDEGIYNFACQRAQEIVTDFSHNGCGNYGENIWFGAGYGNDAGSRAHNGWYNSPGHHANYMNAIYGSGACAVYVHNGTTYAVENFALATSPQTDPYANSQYRESNGETLDLTGQQAEAFDNGNTWTASNGIVVYIQSNGNLSTNGNSQADIDACLEYYATHGY